MEKIANKDEERLIGKQLMIVNMIHVENKKVSHGGYSFISPDDISVWSSLDEQMIQEILDSCANLDRIKFFTKVARRFANSGLAQKEKYMMEFTYYTLLRYGELFLREFMYDRLEEFSIEESEYNYNRYIEKYEMVSVSELYGAPETFRKIAMFFVKCFVETVRSVNKTFDWDVVREMLFEKLNWEEYCEIKTRIEKDTCICRRSNPDEG